MIIDNSSPFYNRLSPESQARIDNITLLSTINPAKANFIKEGAQKLYSSIKKYWRTTPLYYFSEEHNMLSMSQENLSDRGSLAYIQKNLFINLIKNKHSDNFDSLREELKNMRTLQGKIIISKFPRGKKLLANQIYHQFESLGKGESMWIDLSSYPGEHAMMGRIECNQDGKYVFQMSNTGAGIDVYPEMHKKQYKNGKIYYQTVLEWGPFDKNVIKKEFFADLMNATLDGKNPKNIDSKDLKEREGKFGEDLLPINAVYESVFKAFKDVEPNSPGIDTPYWSRAQQGPSCVPNSIWSLCRVCLTKDEYKEMRTDIRIRNLERNYKQLISGNDRSTHTKIKCLDQIQKLIASAQKDLIGVPKNFQNIAEDLEESIGKKNEMLFQNKHPLKFNQNITQLPLRTAKLKPVLGEIKANVELTMMKTDKNEPVYVTINRLNGKPTGLATTAYLFYESFLSGDQKVTEKALKSYIAYLKSQPYPSLIQGEDVGELFNICQLFKNLSIALQTVDGTAEGKEKQLAMINIAQTLFTTCFVLNEKTKEIEISKMQEVRELLQAQTKDAIDFARYNKSRKSSFPPVWLNYQKNLRPFHYKKEWVEAYEKESITLFAREILPIKSNLPSLKAAQITKKSIGLGHKQEEESLFITASFFQFQNDASAIELKSKKNQIVSTTVDGQAYLIYYYLNAGKYQKLKNAMDYLEELNQKGKVGDPKELQQTATLLERYSKDLYQLDKSADGFLAQASALKLALGLLEIANTTSQNQLQDKQIADIKHRLKYYNRLDAQSLGKNTQLKDFFDQCSGFGS